MDEHWKEYRTRSSNNNIRISCEGFKVILHILTTNETLTSDICELAKFLANRECTEE